MKILKFSASWCGPCRKMQPTIDQLVSDGVNIEAVDLETSEGEALAQKYQVASIPTLVFVNGENEVSRLIGLQNKETILSRYNASY